MAFAAASGGFGDQGTQPRVFFTGLTGTLLGGRPPTVGRYDFDGDFGSLLGEVIDHDKGDGRQAAVGLFARKEVITDVEPLGIASIEEARTKGYTETLFGRRRQIPELNNPNFRIRQAGERQAMNAGIQGLAADIFKIALVRIDAAIAKAKLQSTVILQVHDEVIVECPVAERDKVNELVLYEMKNAASLKVPLEVNAAWGDSWASAKA